MEEEVQHITSETSTDKRHLRRIALLQALYTTNFPGQSLDHLDVDYDPEILKGLMEALPEIDGQIATMAPERPVTDIAKIDLNILRLIIYEQMTKKTPVKVLIDEGVELAKEFGGEQSFAFVNAILEKILLADKKEKED
ncbi:MAG: transcription antitermination protein NusB [Pseudomonadales bacterium]|jgi:N utilization substance protein B|nr:transcription antitermination protein NusB [Pseudomonadales bacterium]